jgi:hypothetical protein
MLWLVRGVALLAAGPCDRESAALLLENTPIVTNGSQSCAIWRSEPILCHCTYIDAITNTLETLNLSFTKEWEKVRNEKCALTSQPAQYTSDYTHYRCDEEVASSTRGNKSYYEGDKFLVAKGSKNVYWDVAHCSLVVIYKTHTIPHPR